MIDLKAVKISSNGELNDNSILTNIPRSLQASVRCLMGHLPESKDESLVFAS